MYRCGHCIWFARRKNGFKGKCVCTDADVDMLTKRCMERFEKRKLYGIRKR